jgi:hypothetical protein
VAASLAVPLAAWLALGAGLDPPAGEFQGSVVFVSRHPVPGEPGAVPGLGPHHRAITTGGRLLIRERKRIRPLLGDGTLHDVADPAVSWDGGTIAFAGTPHPDSGWRIYLVRLDGSGLRAVTRSDPARRHDDFDPCWISDRSLCFASTREGGRTQYADVPVSNLYVVGLDGTGLARITAERNGAEEPAFDPRTRRLVYSRWWFNRYLAGGDSSGITLDPLTAQAGDSVNLWQAVELAADGSTFRLAAGAIGSRRGTMAYQPAVLADGTPVGVYAANLGLSPRPGNAGIQRFPDRYGEARRVIGPIIDESQGSEYSPRGLAAPSACSPAPLPDGGMVFAWDRGARGDFGIYRSDAYGEKIEPIADLPGTLELDPAPVIVHAGAASASASALEPFPSAAAASGTFTYFCRNVFANGPLDSPVPPGPRLAADLRLRFFALASRSERPGGDTAVLVREVPVGPAGEVRAEGLAAGVPMFEQLVDLSGHAVMTAHGPAHVRGANFGVAGGTSRCVGCHLGHSTLPAAATDEEHRWFDAAPSADVTASSAAPGTAGPRAVVDRRTQGPPNEVAWVAASDTGEWVELAWPMPIEVREVVLHPPRADRRARTDARIAYAEVSLMSKGRVASRHVLEAPLEPAGTRIRIEPVTGDRLVVRIARARGGVGGRPAASLAEIEAIARLP